MRKTRQLKKAALPMKQMSLNGMNQNVWVCPYCLRNLYPVNDILPVWITDCPACGQPIDWKDHIKSGGIRRA